MANQKFIISVLVLLAFALAACLPAVKPAVQPAVSSQAERMVTQEPTGQAGSWMEMEQPTQTDAMAENTPDAIRDEHTNEATMEGSSMVEETTATGSASTEIMSTEDTSLADTPGWFDIQLTNVTTDETFSINDFQGKVVLVETLAIWCSNCRKQQNQVIDLHTLLGQRDDFVSVGLDIDPNENSTQLKDFINQNGFNWTYAIAPAALGNEIANLYGSQFLNPPSTPMLIIDRQGSVHPLPFGIKSAEQLKEALDPFLQESM